MNFETQYRQLLDLVSVAPRRKTRNAYTRALFGIQIKTSALTFNSFPLIQGRKMFWKGIVGELAAFFNQPHSLEDFEKQGCNYWKPWATEAGFITIDYGNAWRNFGGVDQLADVVKSLKNDPMSRRHLISGWRPGNIKFLSLPCCHYAYQWFVTNDKQLDMIWIQRSVDSMVGLPSDIASAALFNILMAQTVGLRPGELTLQLGDTHIYESHMTDLKLYQSQAIDINYSLPSWWLDPKATVFNFQASMFEVLQYKYEPAIKFEVIK